MSLTDWVAHLIEFCLIKKYVITLTDDSSIAVSQVAKALPQITTM